MKRRGLQGLFLLAVLLLFVVPGTAGLYTDWLWFEELGYASVFLRTLNAQVVVFTATLLAAFAFLLLNFRAARGTVSRPPIVLGTGADGQPIVIEPRAVSGLVWPVALVVSFLVAVSAASHWLEWLSYFNAQPFGQEDPLFGRNVSFYVFELPVLQLLRGQLLSLTVVALIGTGALYVLSGSFSLEPRFGSGIIPTVRLAAGARRHLGLLAALAFLLMAWGAWLEVPETLLTPASVIYGASYADVYARIPILRITVVVLVLAAALALVFGFGRRLWPLVVGAGVYVVLSVGGGIYASLVQNLLVTPNELQKEQPYIAHNIAGTRQAYALDRVEERELSGDALLGADDIARNADTIENVRLWDHQPLLQTFAQIQEIRTYYDFVSVDNDRYVIDGKYRQVMLSARELNVESLPTRTWVNERLTYTHGHGLTLGPVNQVTTEGLPVLFIKDLPPASTVNLPVVEPSIYYGELSSSYALVKTKTQEFHYPRGEENVYSFYEGSGGVPVGGLFRRLLFALRFRARDILFTGEITADSRIMFHRRIGDRVKRLAPFLTFDVDPYPVVSEGRLFWIQDAYTTSDRYPYATPTRTPSGAVVNYIRNSVKIVIDAYNGTTTFYLAEPEDPIALTLARIFPDLLRPLDDMPADLRGHVRYPEDIFKIQAAVFTTYHMTIPQVFYSKEDQWQIPVLDTERNAAPMQPYYMIMRLPGESRSEFIQMLPFTPRLKDNLAAWMVARSDREHYGRLLVFQFPKQKIVYGPRQIVARINQDQIISPQVTLWNQQGSEVIWGTLLVIPIEESLLYVRPLYLRSPEGRIPELKRVIVAYQSRIVMAETLTLALMEIFGRQIADVLAPDQFEAGAPQPVAAPEPGAATAQPAVADLAAQARAHYERALRAQRDGNWALYGEEIKKLGEVLDRLARARR